MDNNTIIATEVFLAIKILKSRKLAGLHVGTGVIIIIHLNRRALTNNQDISRRDLPGKVQYMPSACREIIDQSWKDTQ